MGISTATFYKWRAKYGGMNVSMMSRIKDLEEENRRLKKLYLQEKLKAEIVSEALKIKSDHNNPTIHHKGHNSKCRVNRHLVFSASYFYSCTVGISELIFGTKCHNRIKTQFNKAAGSFRCGLGCLFCRFVFRDPY